MSAADATPSPAERLARLRAEMTEAAAAAGAENPKERRRVTTVQIAAWLDVLDAIAAELAAAFPAAPVVVRGDADSPPWPFIPGGKCARTACDAEGLHRHRDTGMYYCSGCARRINAACLDDTLIPVTP